MVKVMVEIEESDNRKIMQLMLDEKIPNKEKAIQILVRTHPKLNGNNERTKRKNH